jgi:hypothetical protein
LILVEDGPWDDAIDDRLRRVQDRLYDCLDVLLDGGFSDRYPRAKGKDFIVRVDCYSAPTEVGVFFEEFTKGVLEIPEYREALNGSVHVRSVRFAISFDGPS